MLRSENRLIIETKMIVFAWCTEILQEFTFLLISHNRHLISRCIMYFDDLGQTYTIFDEFDGMGQYLRFFEPGLFRAPIPYIWNNLS